MKNATHPCDPSSLGTLISCLDTECLVTTSDMSGMSVSLTPKAQFSCQQSFVPGSDAPTPSLTLSGNGDCVNSPYDFKSFISNASSPKHMKAIAKQCHMKLYKHDGCKGAATKIDMGQVKDKACTFHGGKSARLQCDGHSHSAGISHRFMPTVPSIDVATATSLSLPAALRELEHLCANRSSPASNSTAPKAPFGANVTATASGTMTALPSTSMTQTTSSPFPGLANKECCNNPSVAALVAVIAAALAML